MKNTTEHRMCADGHFGNIADWECMQSDAVFAAMQIPEVRLAVAVLINAFRDARDPQHHEELVEWVGSENFESWCDALDVESHVVASKVVEVVQEYQNQKKAVRRHF